MKKIRPAEITKAEAIVSEAEGGIFSAVFLGVYDNGESALIIRQGDEEIAMTKDQAERFHRALNSLCDITNLDCHVLI